MILFFIFFYTEYICVYFIVLLAVYVNFVIFECYISNNTSIVYSKPKYIQYTLSLIKLYIFYNYY